MTRIAEDPAFNAVMSKGFDVGEEVFEEYLQLHPLTDAPQVPALGALTTLTQIGMRVSPYNTLDRINRLSDKQLEGYLLLEAAKSRALASKTAAQ